MDLRKIVPACLLVGLVGCVSVVPPKQAPVGGLPSTTAVVATRLPSDAEKQSATSIEGTYFGATGARGSVAAGALFGVIGVLGNIAYINAENRDRAEALTELTATNLADVLRAQLQDRSPAPVGTDGGYELVPAANVYFQDQTTYWLTCTLNARATGPAAAGWNARYAVAVEGLMDARKPADTQRAIESLGPCLRDAHALFASHLDGTLAPFEARVITTPRIDGKGDIDQVFRLSVAALPDRAITNDAFGLAQLRKDQVKAIREATPATP